MLRILYIAYMVDISRAKSATIKVFLQVINTVKSFLWLDYRRSSVPTNTGRSTTNSQELTLLVRKRSLLRVVVSKVQLPQSDPNLFLLMTLSSQLHRSTIRIWEDGTDVV